MELPEDKIQRIKTYIKAHFANQDDYYFDYFELRDAIRYAFSQKFTFTVSRGIVKELDKRGVIIPAKIGRNNKIICWKLKD